MKVTTKQTPATKVWVLEPEEERVVMQIKADQKTGFVRFNVGGTRIGLVPTSAAVLGRVILEGCRVLED